MNKLPIETSPDDSLIERNLIPDHLQEDKYFSLNDHSEVQKEALAREIEQRCEGLEKWEVICAKMEVEGVNVDDLPKRLRKRRKNVQTTRNSMPYKLLKTAYCLLYNFDRPSKKALLEARYHRLYIDNEKDNPMVALKAMDSLARLNEDKTKGAGGANIIQIVINNEILPKGRLDV